MVSSPALPNSPHLGGSPRTSSSSSGHGTSESSYMDPTHSESSHREAPSVNYHSESYDTGRIESKPHYVSTLHTTESLSKPPYSAPPPIPPQPPYVHPSTIQAVNDHPTTPSSYDSSPVYHTQPPPIPAYPMYDYDQKIENHRTESSNDTQRIETHVIDPIETPPIVKTINYSSGRAVSRGSSSASAKSGSSAVVRDVPPDIIRRDQIGRSSSGRRHEHRPDSNREEDINYSNAYLREAPHRSSSRRKNNSADCSSGYFSRDSTHRKSDRRLAGVLQSELESKYSVLSPDNQTDEKPEALFYYPTQALKRNDSSRSSSRSSNFSREAVSRGSGRSLKDESIKIYETLVSRYCTR